jgi:hypothetical protein
VLEDLVFGPRVLDIGFPRQFIHVRRHLFDLLLLLQVVHCVLPHQVIGYM